MTATRRKRKPVRHDPQEPIRAVVYTRLSRAKTGATKDKAERNTEASLETQRAGCEAHITALGGVVVATEHDVSAGDRLDNRAGLFRALDRLHSGEANTLIVHSLERLSRDPMQQAGVTLEVRKAGGQLLSATETIHNDGPMGDAINILLGVAGAVELARTRERINRSFESKFRQAGRYKPSQRPLYGYRKVGSKEATIYEIDEGEARIVRRIFTERARGTSVRHIMDGLRRDGVPTPTGSGQWGTATVNRILTREVYWSGKHRCWLTRTERDGANIPFIEDRDDAEQYTVDFPPIIDPALAARARATAERNQWSSSRNDRPAEFGIGRFGYFRCANCGRALSVCGLRDGRIVYRCTASHHASRPCPAPVVMGVPALDSRVWWWVQGVMEHPAQAEGWRLVRKASEIDAAITEGLRLAESEIAEMEAKSAQLVENLTFLTGEAARAAGERLNELAEGLRQRRDVRDALATAAAATAGVFPEVTALEATTALTAAVEAALDAMIAADPHPERTHGIGVRWPDGRIERREVPDSWAAKRAAMSVLGVSATLAREDAEGPRWAAEMRLANGALVRGADNGAGWFSTASAEAPYLSHSLPSPASAPWRPAARPCRGTPAGRRPRRRQ